MLDYFTEIVVKHSDQISASAYTILVTIFGVGLKIFADNISKIREFNNNKHNFYCTKTYGLVDSSFDTILKIIFNKILIANNTPNISTWQNNIFLLHKDILLLRAQLAIYAPEKVLLPIAEFSDEILSMDNNKILSEWNNLVQKAGVNLNIVRTEMAKTLFGDHAQTSKQMKTPIPGTHRLKKNK